MSSASSPTRSACSASGSDYQNIAIWASDAYHHDGADSWSAIRNMTDAGVPADTQADLLGGNARRIYGIEAKLFVTEEPEPLERPAWFPQGPELDEWADRVAHPRENQEELAVMAEAEGSAIAAGGMRTRQGSY